MKTKKEFSVVARSFVIAKDLELSEAEDLASEIDNAWVEWTCPGCRAHSAAECTCEEEGR